MRRARLRTSRVLPGPGLTLCLPEQVFCVGPQRAREGRPERRPSPRHGCRLTGDLLDALGLLHAGRSRAQGDAPPSTLPRARQRRKPQRRRAAARHLRFLPHVWPLHQVGLPAFNPAVGRRGGREGASRLRLDQKSCTFRPPTSTSAHIYPASVAFADVSLTSHPGPQASFLDTNYRDHTVWETSSISSGSNAGPNVVGETRQVDAPLRPTNRLA